MNSRLKEWYTDPAKQQKLATLLDSDIFKEAVQVLTEDQLPKDDGREMPSAETLTFAAMNFKKLAGFFDFHRKLKALCSPPPQGPQGAPPAYSDEHVKEWAAKNNISLPDKSDQPA